VLVAAVVCYGVFFLLAEVTSNPDFRESIGLPRHSFNYVPARLLAFPVAFLVCWPAMLALSFGFQPTRPVTYLSFVVSGLTWVMVWDLCARWFRRARK
jgi:hypothetical protein